MEKNTKISYLYRDASNWKVHNECVIKGVLSPAQIKTILDCCDCEYFIPSNVGLPEKRFEKWTEDDHIWFEFNEWEDCFEETLEPANVNITCDELVAAFERCKDNWEGQKFGKTATPTSQKELIDFNLGHSTVFDEVFSKIEFEDRHPSPEYDFVTYDFVAPKELLEGKYPEAHSLKIRIKFEIPALAFSLSPEDASVKFSPTKYDKRENCFFNNDWFDVDMPPEKIERLLALAEKSLADKTVDQIIDKATTTSEEANKAKTNKSSVELGKE